MKRLTFIALALCGLFATMIHAAEESRVYELRVYTCNEGKLDALLARTGWPSAELNARLLELELDNTLADRVVRIAAAHPSTAGLASLGGAVTVTGAA